MRGLGWHRSATRDPPQMGIGIQGYRARERERASEREGERESEACPCNSPDHTRQGYLAHTKTYSPGTLP